MMRFVWVFGFVMVAGCVGLRKEVITAPTVETNVEKTTIVVKDPQGNVLRIEEKEMVLQQYTAREPVGLTSTKAPAVLRTKMVNGVVVEATE